MSKDPALAAFHATPVNGSGVAVPGKMEEPMERQTREFEPDGPAVAPSLTGKERAGEYDLSDTVAKLEREHIRCTILAAVTAVQGACPVTVQGGDAHAAGS